jgi:hypothetical protein
VVAVVVVRVVVGGGGGGGVVGGGGGGGVVVVVVVVGCGLRCRRRSVYPNQEFAGVRSIVLHLGSNLGWLLSACAYAPLVHVPMSP